MAHVGVSAEVVLSIVVVAVAAAAAVCLPPFETSASSADPYNPVQLHDDLRCIASRSVGQAATVAVTAAVAAAVAEV